MSHTNLHDHLRLLAAGLVLYSHHFALWGLPEPQAVGTSLGGVGVNIFFVLSGFLVSNSLLSDAGTGRFLVRRALRILPGLSVNVLLCALVLGTALTTLPLREYLAHEQFRAFFMNLVFQPRFQLPAVFADVPVPLVVNGSLWTLPFEILAYLVLAGVSLWPRLSLRTAGPVLALASLLALAWWRPADPVVFWGNDLRHVPLFMALFFAGATVAVYRQSLVKADLVIAVMCVWLFMPEGRLRPLVAVLMFSLLVIYVGSRQVDSRYALKSDCSYGVYLYACPIQQTFIQLAAPWGFWPTLALSAVTTYVLAWLSWRLIESQALKLKPRRPAPA